VEESTDIFDQIILKSDEEDNDEDNDQINLDEFIYKAEIPKKKMKI
jgi:hypothetical protein